MSFVSPELQSPRESTEGSQGQERMLEVELQTIADIGMVFKMNSILSVSNIFYIPC